MTTPSRKRESGSSDRENAPSRKREAGNAENTRSRESPGAANLRPGWGVIAEVTSRGGITYEPAMIAKDQNARVVTHTHTIDDEKLDKWVTQTRNAILNLFRQITTHTDMKIWFASGADLEKLEEELDPYRKTIVKINRYARSVSSNRETRCEYWAMPWMHNDLKLRLRVGQMIHERMTDLREAYTDKRKDRYRVEMDKCHNLEKLVFEPQAGLIRNAINASEQQRPLIIRNYGGSNIPLELRKTNLKDLDFDYVPIDAAIEEFAPSAAWFVSELPDL